MRSISLVLICALLGLSAAWSITNEHEVLDHHAISFKVALEPQNLKTLDSLFWELSNPKSPNFGQYLSNEQIADLISLPEGEISAVESYITKRDGEVCAVYASRSVHQDYILVDTCAGQAKLIFPNLNLSVYQHEEKPLVLRSSILMDVAHNLHLLGVPQELHGSIAGIHGITDAPINHTRATTTINPSEGWFPTDKELTVNSMIEYFGVTYSAIDSSSYSADEAQVRQSVVEFNNAAFGAQELATFQQRYNVPSNPIAKVIGAEETSEESGEASLDVQTITAIGANVVTWDFVFDATASFLEVTETIMNTEGSPKVVSCSWGGTDSEYTQSQANAVNTSFMKLGLAGFSFFIASGDSGPTLSASCNTFNPQFPVGSAYVTAVGGTKLNEDTNGEGAWFHSSGGFSGLIDRPAYQADVVSTYLNTTQLPPNANGQVYSTTGRAYPDVSAFGAWELILANGSYQEVGGTSGASPQFAGMISLINIQRYQDGLGPLGPLNQTLYGLNGGIGSDVTEGQTYATNRQNECPNQYLPGFLAATGWDAATGLGSPKFSVLQDALLNIPGEAGKRRNPKHHHHHHKREFLPVE